MGQGEQRRQATRPRDVDQVISHTHTSRPRQSLTGLCGWRWITLNKTSDFEFAPMKAIFTYLLFIALGATFCCATQATELRVGVADVDITPPLGIPLAGYYHARGADGVLDPLFSKALVMEVQGTRAAWIAVDLISVTRLITDQARAVIEQTTGIPADHVIIAATHTHTAPVLAGRGQRDLTLDGEQSLSADYTDGLPAKIAESVRLANERLEPAQLRATSGHCEDLTFNRRYFMRDGTVGWNPGKLNPNIVTPAGPSDPEVGILYVEKPDATSPSHSIATWVNFAMHTDTTGGRRISADWPGALSRVLAGYHGADHFTMVTLGACGNLNHLDFSWRWPQSTPIEQHRIATILGASVFQAYKNLQAVSSGPLRAKSAIVELALPEITPEQIAEATATLAAIQDDRGADFMKQVRAYRVLDVAGREGRPHRVEVQAISLGHDVAWVTLPGEVFVELGLAIKQRSPFPHTHVVTMANENIGYIPDRRSYAEGNYEPESARCAPGSGEQLVEAAVDLLTSLYP